MNHSSIFSEIYKVKAWGQNGSGDGSLPENTIQYRAFLQEFMRQHKIKSVLDLGCGDWQFSKLINWTGIRYTGLDVVLDLILQNKKLYESSNIKFGCDSLLDYPLDGFDLILVKDVLQHLRNSHITEFLVRLQNSSIENALITNCNFNHPMKNKDIQDGHWRPIDILNWPLKLPGRVVLQYGTKSVVWWHKWYNH